MEGRGSEARRRRICGGPENRTHSPERPAKFFDPVGFFCFFRNAPTAVFAPLPASLSLHVLIPVPFSLEKR